MVMPPRPCSSGMQSIRRELQRRRPKPLAPKRSTTTKQSAPSLPPPRPKLQEDLWFAASGSAGTHAPRPPRPRPQAPPHPAAISQSTLLPPPPPPTRSAPSSIGSASPSYLGADDVHLRPGTEVGVRTRTTTLKTGEVLVLWLRAMVVSPTHAGYEVVYDGNWPPGDPYGTVHVPRRHVRKMEPSPSPSSAPSSSASHTAAAAAVAATLKKEMRPAPRPTTAGKSLRLIRRSLLPEMEGNTQALLGY
ncbi:unnamed protein product [Urochloa decumbens]|uniref:Uncharacterized protein n=1 Tax=Urochloa decumbens TaxID=240449 RepID=A0ABC9ETH6_9POAL